METKERYRVVKKLVEFEIPGLPPASQSPNSRDTWQRRHRERKEFMQAVGLAALAAGVKDLKLTGVEITGELVVAQKRVRDMDNLMIRFSKPICDSLVNLGILADDSPDHVTVRYVLVKVDPATAPRTIVTIWVEP